jgi:hypothetical protein
MLLLLAVVALLVVGGGAFVLSSGGDDEEAGGAGTSSTTASADQGGGSSASGREDEGSEGSSDGDGGSASSGSGGSFEEVVEAFIAAMAEGDCETLVGLTTERMDMGMDPEMAVEECEVSQEGATAADSEMWAGLEIITPTQTGDVAEVICSDRDDPSLMVTFTVVREDGAWLIDAME